MSFGTHAYIHSTHNTYTISGSSIKRKCHGFQWSFFFERPKNKIIKMGAKRQVKGKTHYDRLWRFSTIHRCSCSGVGMAGWQRTLGTLLLQWFLSMFKIDNSHWFVTHVCGRILSYEQMCLSRVRILRMPCFAYKTRLVDVTASFQCNASVVNCCHRFLCISDVCVK